MPTAPFDQSKPLVVRREFVANGRTYKPGDGFSWKDKAVAVRIVKNLYDMGKLRHVGDDDAPELREDVEAVEPQESEPEQAESPFPKVYGSRPASKWTGPDLSDNADAQTADNLDEIDDIKILRAIAEEEGAENKRSKDDLRKSIRENRAKD